MTNFTTAEKAIMKPALAALAAANAAVATAGGVTDDADAQHVALLAKIDALGGEPQPNDFETSAAWQTAQAEHRFNLAKLQPGIVPLADKVAAAHVAYAAALPAIQEAQNLIDQAVVNVLGARIELTADRFMTEAVDYMRAHEKMPIGYAVDRPRGLTYYRLGQDIIAIGLSRNVDISTIAAD